MSNALDVQTAARKRATHPDFVRTFSVYALRDRVPLSFPVPEDVPRSPKRRYRSAYHYLGYDDLCEPTAVAHLTFFEVVLRLVDFAPLRNYLAQCYYAPSAKGQTPFDPVSLFLCVCLRRELGIGWRKLAKLLTGEHGSGWRRRFGFSDAETPSASGLRYFFKTLGAALFDELCPLFADLLQEAGLLPEHSTFPGDPAQRGVSISHDIMLHHAHANMHCAKVTDTCYLPAPRPCPAKEAGDEQPAPNASRGCDCTTDACAQVCRRTTPADKEARYIYYSGRNKQADLLPTPQEGQGQHSGNGRHVYGYASNPDRILDDRFACAWTIRTGLYPANVDERAIACIRPTSMSAPSSRAALPSSARASLTSRSAKYSPTPPSATSAVWTPSGPQAPCVWSTSVLQKGMTTQTHNYGVGTTRKVIRSASTATRCTPTVTITPGDAPSGAVRKCVSRPQPMTQRKTHHPPHRTAHTRQQRTGMGRSSTSVARCLMGACAWRARWPMTPLPGRNATGGAASLRVAMACWNRWA
jgi:hypothetical protein